MAYQGKRDIHKVYHPSHHKYIEKYYCVRFIDVGGISYAKYLLNNGTWCVVCWVDETLHGYFETVEEIHMLLNSLNNEGEAQCPTEGK